VQRSRRKPETHLEAERWNTVTPREKPKADDGPKYMVTGCLREWAVVDGIRMRHLGRQSTITEGAFVTLGNDNGMDAYRISSKENGSQQEWYREGEQPVVSCIIAGDGRLF